MSLTTPRRKHRFKKTSKFTSTSNEDGHYRNSSNSSGSSLALELSPSNLHQPSSGINPRHLAAKGEDHAFLLSHGNINNPTTRPKLRTGSSTSYTGKISLLPSISPIHSNRKNTKQTGSLNTNKNSKNFGTKVQKQHQHHHTISPHIISAFASLHPPQSSIPPILKSIAELENRLNSLCNELDTQINELDNYSTKLMEKESSLCIGSQEDMAKNLAGLVNRIENVRDLMTDNKTQLDAMETQLDLVDLWRERKVVSISRNRWIWGAVAIGLLSIWLYR